MENKFNNSGNIFYLNRSNDNSNTETNGDLAEIISFDNIRVINREQSKSLYLPDSTHSVLKFPTGKTLIILNGISSFSATKDIWLQYKDFNYEYSFIILENSNLDFLPQVRIANKLSRIQNIPIFDPFISPFSSSMIDFLSKKFTFLSGLGEINSISLIYSHLQSLGWEKDTIRIFIQAYFRGYNINDIENISSNSFFSKAFISQLKKISLYMSMQNYSNFLLENNLGNNILSISSVENIQIFFKRSNIPKIGESILNYMKKDSDSNGMEFARLLVEKS
jgi:hypothetical protein